MGVILSGLLSGVKESFHTYWLVSLSLCVVLMAIVCGSIAWSMGGFSQINFRFAFVAGFLVALMVGVGVFRVAYELGFSRVNWNSALYDGGVIGLASILIALAIWQFGRVQFGGMDHGIMIEVAWRMIQGQKPYVDYSCLFPVGFVLGAFWAFRLFGVNWSAIVGWDVLFSVLTFIWTYLLLVRLGLRRDFALLFSASWQAAINIVVAYWWYNTATSMAAVLFFLSALCFWLRPMGQPEALSYVISLVLIASMKPNVAGPLIAGTTLALITSHPHRWRVIAFSMIAFVIFAGGLGLWGVSVPQLMGSYLSVSGRAFTFHQFLQDTTIDEKVFSLFLIVAASVPFLFIRTFNCVGKQADLMVTYSAAVGSMFGLIANGELKVVDLPLLMAAGVWIAMRQARTTMAANPGDGEEAALGLVSVEPIEGAKGTHGLTYHGRNTGRLLGSWIVGLAVLVLVFCVISGALRERVRAIGNFFEYRIPTERVSAGFFKGMRASAELMEYNDALGRWVKDHPHDIPYLGPRMVWGYAAYRIRSPQNIPPWWQPGVAFDARDEDKWLNNWIQDKFYAVILKRYSQETKNGEMWHADYTFLPRGMLRDLVAHYDQIHGYAPLVVFQRK